MPFDTNVFVNCPFDDAYRPLLRPILFAIVRLGFSPRIALESPDSGSPRLARILALIDDSKYAVHDLSRIQAEKAGDIYRLNMPFELGLDVGCRLFRSDHRREKKCLVLEAQPFRYHAGISDLSGSDIAVHNDEPADALAVVRDWLNTVVGLRAAGASAIWTSFSDFMAQNYEVLKGRGYSNQDIERMPVPDLIEDMQRWVRAIPP